MDGKMATSRREALGLASIVMAGAAIGVPAASAAPRSPGKRPTAEELERAKRLYGGELGGGRGGR